MTKIRVICKVRLKSGNYFYPEPEVMEDFLIQPAVVLNWIYEENPNEKLQGMVIDFYKENNTLFVECEEYVAGKDLT